MFEFPVLIGDIGGTNARFGLVERKGDKPRTLSHEATADHADPSAAIRAALGKGGQDAPPPRSAILAIAGRIDGPEIQLTNAHWKVSGERIAGDFDLSSATIVNDYVPVAAGAAEIEPHDLTPIGRSHPVPGGARVVLGPGTGFGAAALVPYSSHLAIVSTEAGHTDIGPADSFEEQVWHALERVEDRITVETVLSGPASRGCTRRWRMSAPGARTTRSTPPPSRKPGSTPPIPMRWKRWACSPGCSAGSAATSP